MRADDPDAYESTAATQPAPAEVAGEKIAYRNPAWFAYTGDADAQNMTTDFWLAYVHPDDRRGAWDAWQNARSAKTIFTHVVRLRRADGSYRAHRLRIAPFAATDDAWVGSAEDLHDDDAAPLQHVLLPELTDHSTRMRDAAADASIVEEDLRPIARLEETFPAEPLSAAKIRAALAHFLASAPISEDDLFHLMLAVGEAANNAIEHAYVGPGNVVLRAQVFAHATIVEIVDFGRWRPLRAMDDRARPRGRGLAMMGAAVPDMRIHRSPAGTHVRFALERPT